MRSTPRDPALSRSRRLRAILYGAVLAAVPLTAAHSQYFGRNKVLWERFEFEVVDTAHFSVHSYPPGAPVAATVARLAERWYGRFASIFDYEFKERNPLIIYQDHADFQQTLTTSGLLGEGIGGFTESLQNRVVLPLTGVNASNDHVIGHELVHAFQFAMMQDTPAETNTSSQPQLPQWATEGLAEYLSEGREDPQTAMWMRDAVLHATLPDPEKMNRIELSLYQYGQAIWAYIGGRWGDRTAVRLYVHAAQAGADTAIREVLQIEPAELFAEVHSSLRGAYEPVLASRLDAASIATPLSIAAERGARLNIAPALSPDGTRLAFLSSREIFTTDLYLADTATGAVLTKLVSEEADPHFDYLSYIDSSVAWSSDGRRLVFTVFARGERQLVIFDVGARRVERTIPVPGIKGIRNPAWSPDGASIAFSATAGGASDLYRVALESGTVERLTADPYTSIQPAFSTDGRRIAFVTDRNPNTSLETLSFGSLQIALLDLETKRVEPLLIFPRGKHINPQFSPDGASLYFIGEPDGVPDVFRYDLESRQTTRLTAVKTGVTGITAVSPALSVAATTGQIAFSVLENGHLNIYQLDAAQALPDPPAFATAARLPPESPSAFDVVQGYLDDAAPPQTLDAARTPYEPRLGLTYVGPATVGVSVDAYGTGISGTLSAYFTDTLNTRQIASTLYGGTSDGYIDFEDALGGETVYLNQKGRFQWGILGARLPYLSGYTLLGTGSIDVDGTPVPADFVYTVTDVVTANEISAFSQYPFSLTRRVEVAGGVSHISYDRKLVRDVYPYYSVPPFSETFDLEGPPPLDLQNASLAYISDTSYYGFLSPLRGRRFRLEYEWTTGDLDFQTTLFDYRRYFFRNPLTFAFRALHIGRRGTDAESFQLTPLDIGSDNFVRGYELGSFDASECTPIPNSPSCPEYDRLFGSRIAVLNLELRIPLLGTRDFGLFRAPAFPTEGVFFVDVGAAWSESDPVVWEFERDTTERVPVVSAGFAARILLGGFLPIQLYYAVPFQRPSEDRVFGFVISTGW
jgi:Tol biopolymer transport system component